MADEGPAAFDLAANQNKLQGISLVHLGQPQWFLSQLQSGSTNLNVRKQLSKEFNYPGEIHKPSRLQIRFGHRHCKICV